MRLPMDLWLGAELGCEMSSPTDVATGEIGTDSKLVREVSSVPVGLDEILPRRVALPPNAGAAETGRGGKPKAPFSSIV